MLPAGLFFRRMIDFHTRFAIFHPGDVCRLPLHLVRLFCFLSPGSWLVGWRALSSLWPLHRGTFHAGTKGLHSRLKRRSYEQFLTPKGTNKITLMRRRACAPHALHCRLQHPLNQPMQPHRRTGTHGQGSTKTQPTDLPKDPPLFARDPRSSTKDLSGLRSRGKDGGGSGAGTKELNPC